MQTKSEHAVFHICKRHIRHCGDTVKDKARGDNLAGFVLLQNILVSQFVFHKLNKVFRRFGSAALPIFNRSARNVEILRKLSLCHLMRLPNKDAETNRIPYILLQFLTGEDTQQTGNEPDSECKIRIVVATYSEDASAGSMDLLNIITRIRIALLKEGVIGKQFMLRKPLEYVVYPDETGSYYLFGRG